MVGEVVRLAFTCFTSDASEIQFEPLSIFNIAQIKISAKSEFWVEWIWQIVKTFGKQIL